MAFKNLGIWLWYFARQHGFPFWEKEGWRTIYLQTPEGSVRISAGCIRGKKVLSVTQACKKITHYTFPHIVIAWEASIDPNALTHPLKIFQKGSGIANQKKLIQNPLSTEKYFPDKMAHYAIRSAWSESAICSLFENPEALAIVNRNGSRILCKKTNAKAIERYMRQSKFFSKELKTPA